MSMSLLAPELPSQVMWQLPQAQVDATAAFCIPAAPQPPASLVQVISPPGCMPVNLQPSMTAVSVPYNQLAPPVQSVQLSPPVSTGFIAPRQQWEPQQQQQQQQQQQALPTSVFFAGVTPVADGQRLRLLFSQFGRVQDLNLFRPYNGCRTSKGFGVVVFAQHSEAAAALETLNGRFVWPGARSPMVIEWCDPSKQHKKKRAQPLAHSLLMQQPGPPVQFLQYAPHSLLAQQPLPQPLPQHLPQQTLAVSMLPAAIPMAGQQLAQVQVQMCQMVNQHVF